MGTTLLADVEGKIAFGIVKQDTPKVLSHSGYCMTHPPHPPPLPPLQKIKLYVTLLSDLSPQKRLRSVAALEKQREKKKSHKKTVTV